MRGTFWRGLIAGSIIGATMSMYMKPEKKARRSFLGSRRRRQATRMIKGVTKTVQEMMK
ncbi:MAG: YtxH domain-containing protein [Desulfotomaculum sp.]|nr:YtxH domain-containing protein [Desulfotomaculum sp.]